MDSRLRDRELVISLQGGDLNALGVLFDRHQTMVYRTALAIIGDTDAAADILQEAFLRLHRFAKRVDPARPLEPWLYRVTANLSYSWVKRRGRWFSRLGDLAEYLVGDTRETPDDLAESESSWREIQKAVVSLPLAQRVVVVLHYLNDQSVEQIAEILSIPEGTVKSRLHYGRKELRRRLGLDRELVAGAWYEVT
jgi:RNA polymerase sigma-70 factor (ECF subfamily)